MSAHSEIHQSNVFYHYTWPELYERVAPGQLRFDRYCTIVTCAIAGPLTNLIILILLSSNVFFRWSSVLARRGPATRSFWLVPLLVFSLLNILGELCHILHDLNLTWDVASITLPGICQTFQLIRLLLRLATACLITYLAYECCHVAADCVLQIKALMRAGKPATTIADIKASKASKASTGTYITGGASATSVTSNARKNQLAIMACLFAICFLVAAPSLYLWRVDSHFKRPECVRRADFDWSEKQADDLQQIEEVRPDTKGNFFNRVHAWLAEFVMPGGLIVVTLVFQMKSVKCLKIIGLHMKYLREGHFDELLQCCSHVEMSEARSRATKIGATNFNRTLSGATASNASKASRQLNELTQIYPAIQMVVITIFLFVFLSAPIVIVFPIMQIVPIGDSMMSLLEIKENKIWQRYFEMTMVKQVFVEIDSAHFIINLVLLVMLAKFHFVQRKTRRIRDFMRESNYSRGISTNQNFVTLQSNDQSNMIYL